MGTSDSLSRAGTVIGLLVHLNRDAVSRLNLAEIGTGASSADQIACKVVGRHIGNGRVPGGHSHAVAALINTVDPHLLECGMCRRRGDERGN